LAADENENENGDDVAGDALSSLLVLLLLMYPAKLNIGVHLDAADVELEEVVVVDDVRIVSGVPSVFLINTFVYRGVTVEVVFSFEGDGGLTPAVEMTKIGFVVVVVDSSSSPAPVPATAAATGGEEELILLLLLPPLLVMLSSNGNDNVNDVFLFFLLKLNGVARPLVTAAETASPENFIVVSSSSSLLLLVVVVAVVFCWKGGIVSVLVVLLVILLSISSL